ncbi:MAG: hypothetical protein ACTSX1_11345 [Candidatus Heimdallarchaeaceae archaeon]
MTWDWEKLKKQQQGKSFKKPEKKKRKIPDWFWYTGYIICMLALAVALWFPVRWIHYKFVYEGKIEQKIIEMVKPESLKDKYKGI